MEKQLSHEESLEIITRMINGAKKNLARGGSFYFLLWGTVVALANFVIYYLLRFTQVANWYYVWLIAVPAVVVTIWYGRKTAYSATVRGPIDRLYGQIWIGVFVAMMITLVFMSYINYMINPLMLVYSGVGTFITAMLSRYRPLLIGSIVLWAGSIVCFLVDLPQQYLVAGVSIIAGYIIPGLMLRAEER